MKKLFSALAFLFITALAVYFVTAKKKTATGNKQIKGLTLAMNDEEAEKKEGGYKRWLYEWKMLHDPATGKIPKGIRERERAVLSSIIKRQSMVGFRPSINNTYTAVGPTQNGGRTRALAFDMRGNNVVLAAGVSGGIYRSTNGGSTWTFVHPDTSVLRNVTCIAQDPRTGFQDTWYAGTGELLGASASYPNSYFAGNGLLKSTDNGITWTRLASTNSTDDKEVLDDIFDMIFNVQVAPNGYVYVAALNYILVSTDGGANWGYVLRVQDLNQSLDAMITDITISKDGTRYFASFSGLNNSRTTVGVWTSTNGISGWTRIAGGSFGSADSVAGWKAYNPAFTGSTGWGRTIMSVAPSNSNILYVMYENSLSATSNQPEADLFRADLTSYTSGLPATVSWSSNRNSNLRANQNGTTATYIETQGGYNMLLAVHPTNPDLVLAGGVNLFRSTDAFATQGTFIGGLSSTTYSDPNEISHVDFHSYAFDPASTNRFVVGNDGGLQVSSNITATTVSWSNLNSQYQTLQYYHVAIDPVASSLTFAGGAQDNSTSYRDSKLLLTGSALADPNDHYILIGGDGGATALSASTATSQYLYGSVQLGDVYRIFVNQTSPSLTQINPIAAPEGEFVTYFHLDPDNTDLLYYPSLNRLWRTTTASTATQLTGWTEMTGFGSTLTGSIFSMATSRGTYAGSGSWLFVGTDNAKIYRLQDPRNAAAASVPVNITPSGITAGSLVREIAVNPRNPDTVLAVISNYESVSAFWTGNATSASPTWQAVEGNIPLPSFRSCAIVATSTGVEYYAGTSIGLFSTTSINGSSTVWTLEGPAMMKGALVNDLVLRTADNTLLVGTHGNGMFYTTIGNVPTPVSNITENDKRFIASVYPTVTSNNINFVTGNATGIKSITVKLYNTKGQTVKQSTQSFQNGSVNISNLPAGTYFLEVLSDNRKFKHLQKVVKTQ